jgi:phytoene dehydrogenase-like protein
MTQYDAIIIGAGHNGLVTATYLAKAGRKVLVLERRSLPGGQLVTETLEGGWQVDTLHAGAELRPDIVRELGLQLPAITRAPHTVLFGDGARLEFGADLTASTTLEAIRRHSAKDAGRWPEFVAFMHKAGAFLDAAYATTMPRHLPRVDMRHEGLPLAKLALKLRRLGKRDMFNFIRALPMNALELAEEWFESAALRATIAALGIHGHTLGPLSAGTGYTLMHNWLNRGGLALPLVTGGVGGISRSLADGVLAAGGAIRTGAAVTRVRIERSRATGVVLANGEEISAAAVFSAADPRHTLLELASARELPPEFVWHARTIKMRGAVAKLHLQTNGTHGVPAGTHAHAPTLKYLERAYDPCKYGQISEHPYLELSVAGSTVSVHYQFAPFALRDAAWDEDTRALLLQRTLATLEPSFPRLRAAVLQSRVITPLDMARDYGLTEGDLNHGQLTMDQFFFLRPLPGHADHRTPIEGLYLCGNGVHGGGGISGASGRNAAKQFLAGRLEA